MKAKTLQECKDIVAKKHLWKSWEQYLEGGKGLIDKEYMDEVAELYANEFILKETNDIKFIIEKSREGNGGYSFGDNKYNEKEIIDLFFKCKEIGETLNSLNENEHTNKRSNSIIK